MNSTSTTETKDQPTLFPSISDIAAIVNGTALHPGGVPDESGAVRSVAIDSRACGAGALFFALQGEHADGERYVADAAAAGAVCAVVQHERDPDDVSWSLPVIIVNDSLAALHRLAAWYVDTYLSDTVRIGVTGSNGKTTTKEFILAAFSGTDGIYGSPGNFNSETGVPLAVFSTPPGAAIAVYEMAMSAAGEMEALADIIRPEIAVITNIGHAHIGRVGSRDGIAAEKKKITRRFSGAEKLLLFEGDEYADYLREGVPGQVMYFGPETQHAVIAAAGERSTITFQSGLTVNVPIGGRHNCLNALAALRVAEVMNVSPDAVDLGSRMKVLPQGRAQRFHMPEGGVVIHDAYNANTDSMHAALDMIDELRRDHTPGTPLILVLGEMRELGDFTAAAHGEVLEHALRLRPSAIYLVGGEFISAASRIVPEGTAEGGVRAWRRDETSLWGVPQVADFVDLMSRQIKGDEIILLKGSRAMELEKILPFLTEKGGGGV